MTKEELFYHVKAMSSLSKKKCRCMLVLNEFIEEVNITPDALFKESGIKVVTTDRMRLKKETPTNIIIMYSANEAYPDYRTVSTDPAYPAPVMYDLTIKKLTLPKED
jgi:hypothetical protein